MQFNRMERLRLVPGSGTAGRLATIGAVTVLLAATCAAPAQDWPTRPMTLVVPLAAGGSSDGTPAFPGLSLAELSEPDFKAVDEFEISPALQKRLLAQRR